MATKIYNKLVRDLIPDIIMIIEWRKGGKSLFGADKSALQKAEWAFCFYIIATEIVKFRERNLLANQRFAVEIL